MKIVCLLFFILKRVLKKFCFVLTKSLFWNQNPVNLYSNSVEIFFHSKFFGFYFSVCVCVCGGGRLETQLTLQKSKKNQRYKGPVTVGS